MKRETLLVMLTILGTMVIIGLIVFLIPDRWSWLGTIAAVVIGIMLGKFLRDKGYIK